MTQQEMMRVKRAVIRKYPIFASVALLNVPIKEDNSISTAAVYAEKNNKGELILKGIKYNSEFFDNLSFEQKVFVLAHETCHIAFKHFARSLDKPEKDVEREYKEYCSRVSDENLRKIEKIRLQKKYHNYWNIATDACINAFLKKDGLEMPQGVIDKRTGKPMEFVNIEDGLYRRAELIYDSIVKKQENNEKNNAHNDKSTDGNPQENSSSISNNEPSDSEIGGGLDDIDIDNYQGIDSHDEWTSESSKTKEKEVQSEEQKEKKKSFFDKIRSLFNSHSEDKENKQSGSTVTNDEKDTPEISTDEASVFKENENYHNKKDSKSLNQSLDNITKQVGSDSIKPVKPVLSWKQLLIRSVEEDNEIWGYRRANRYSPNARIEDRTLDNRATTEIILDTSGSISDELLKGFLMQLVPLFKESKIKVGCFSGRFYGFTELQTLKQIQEFKAIRDRNGTNFEAAATAFSRDGENEKINKIVFTDGQLDELDYHVQQTKVDGIIWIVFGEKMDFKPLGGRIIRIDQKDLQKMINTFCLTQSQVNCYENNVLDMEKRRR